MQVLFSYMLQLSVCQCYFHLKNVCKKTLHIEHQKLICCQGSQIFLIKKFWLIICIDHLETDECFQIFETSELYMKKSKTQNSKKAMKKHIQMLEPALVVINVQISSQRTRTPESTEKKTESGNIWRRSEVNFPLRILNKNSKFYAEFPETLLANFVFFLLGHS